MPARAASRTVLAAVALATLGAGASCRAQGAAVLTRQPCVGLPAHAEDARCYRLPVAERPGGDRLISLRIVVLPATGSDRAEDPVVPLAGGPGQAATELLRDPSLLRSELRLRRDFVFADQRGTGGSHDLTCRFYGPPDEPQGYFDAFLPLEKVRACRQALESRADLSQYTTSASVDDLEAIRVAFGFPRLNLIGGSYGTRLAMEYLRRHEARVRTVVLEGPVTPRTHAPERFGRHAARALDAVIDECLSTPSCAQAFPRLRDETREVFNRLRQQPVTAVTAHPLRQRSGTVTLTRDHVAEAIRYMLYSSHGASQVPLVLHQAAQGNYDPIASFLIRWRSGGTFDGLYLSITCAEDVPLVADDAVAQDEETFLGSYRVRQQRAACAVWPRGTANADHITPVRSQVPALIASGVLDPVTPPENGDELAKTLSNSLHIRVPYGGHSPVGLAGLGCLEQLKQRFVEQGTVVGIDTACVAGIARRSFATGR